MFLSIFELSDISIQHTPQILLRALHALSLVAVLTMPIQPWSASVVRLWNAFGASKTQWLEWLLASAVASAYPRHWKNFAGCRSNGGSNFKVATTTYKLLLESNEPAYLRSRISFTVPLCSLRSSADDQRLDEHPTRTNIDVRSFRCIARPSGTLPYDIRVSSSVSVFKSKLKAHHFRLAFS